MAFSTSTSRLALLATASLLSVALPASSAWAQKVKDKSATPAQAMVEATDVSVDIPTIDAVDSNVDEATLRSIFSGDLLDNAETLAGLSATSITIPEITLDVSTTVKGETTQMSVTFSDLVLDNVVDGAAQSFSLDSISMDAGDEGSFTFGTLSASQLDIGGMLGLYGLVDAGGSRELATIYSDFVFEGGSFQSPDMSCTIGDFRVGEVKARPLSYSFAEMMSLVMSLEEDQEEPSPEAVGSLFKLYGEFFNAIESTPATAGGIDCIGEEDGKPITFSIAGMSMGAMRAGTYPQISMDGFDVTVEGEGTFKLANVTIKEMDLSSFLAAIENAPDAIDAAWLEENTRALIPAFTGFSLTGLEVDIPDPEAEGQRIATTIGSFDLTLGNYINGIPTDVLTTARNIVVDLPTDSDDPQIQQLIGLGVTRVDAGFTVDANWSEAEDTIVIDEISMSGADLASVALSGTLTSAAEALFSLDENEALAAAMALTVSDLKLDIDDQGLSDIILATVAADQGSDPATMRPVFAGLAEGSVIGLLAGAAEAQKVGAAINSFVSGKAQHLTIDMTAKEQPGLSLIDFMAAESDPSSLVGKVTVDAVAK